MRASKALRSTISGLDHTLRRRLHVYNSLRKSIVPFSIENDAPFITWYSCGPTVYDSAHLGHGRTYVALDILRRLTSRLTGQPVLYAMGVTDVDDKIIARAAERGIGIDELASQYEAEFLSDMRTLNVLPPTVLTRVTEHIDDIVQYISVIVDKGLAYVTPDGVYLDTTAMGGGYGKLMPSQRHGQNSNDADATPATTIEEDPEARAFTGGKRNRRDFALWKLSKSPCEPCWHSPWGGGRPGWHIECSAMTHAVFGPRLDVHAGGIDLAFPHHCNEIAQCEAHEGHLCDGSNNVSAANDGDRDGWSSPWCGTFIHTGHVHIAGAKMSKSLKNFITIRAMLSSGYSADAFRAFVLSHKYRSNVTYSEDRLRDGQAWLSRMSNIAEDALAVLGASEQRLAGGISQREGLAGVCNAGGRWTPHDTQLMRFLADAQASVHEALCNDYDTPSAMNGLSGFAGALHDYVKTNGQRCQPGLLRQSLAALADELDCYGLQAGEALKGRLRSVRSQELSVSSASSDAAVAVEDAARRLSSFRDSVRGSVVALSKAVKAERKKAAAGSGGGAPPNPLLAPCGTALTSIMAACDSVRDADLPALGWACKDGPTGAVLTKAPAKP